MRLRLFSKLNPTTIPQPELTTYLPCSSVRYALCKRSFRRLTPSIRQNHTQEKVSSVEANRASTTRPGNAFRRSRPEHQVPRVAARCPNQRAWAQPQC